MKHLLLTMTVLSVFLMPSVSRAENTELALVLPARPGVLTTASDRPLTYSQLREAAGIRAWKRSLIPVAVSQTLDMTSSYGMRELNPLLAGPNGRFGAKAVSIKLGTTAALVGVEYLLIKKWPSSARIFSKLNWGSAVLTGTFAAHNYAIR
jgi:hypothetical protein